MLREMSGEKEAGDQSMISMVRLDVQNQSVTVVILKHASMITIKGRYIGSTAQASGGIKDGTIAIASTWSSCYRGNCKW